MFCHFVPRQIIHSVTARIQFPPRRRCLLGCRSEFFAQFCSNPQITSALFDVGARSVDEFRTQLPCSAGQLVHEILFCTGAMVLQLSDLLVRIPERSLSARKMEFRNSAVVAAEAFESFGRVN